MTTEVTVLRLAAELLAVGVGIGVSANADAAGSLQFAINFITAFPISLGLLANVVEIIQVSYL